VYVALNGWRALRTYAVRVFIIVAILTLNMTMNAFAIIHMIRAG
jgi:hypothetical protein